MRSRSRPRRGAGTLVFVGRFDLVEFAVVLEPDEPLRTARRAFYAGMAALADALAAHAPPEKPIAFDWPDAISRRRRAGRRRPPRLAAKGRRGRAAATGWCSARMIRTVVDGGGRAGPAPACRRARGRRLRRSRLRPAGRELRAPSHGRDRRLAGAGLRRRREETICRGCRAEAGRAPRHRRQRRSAGAAHGQGRGRAAPACCRRSRRRPGSTRQPEGRAHEAAAHHPARSRRTRSCSSARPSPANGRCRAPSCSPTPIPATLAGQGARGVPRRLPRRRSRSAGRRWCRSWRRARTTRAPWSSSWRSSWSTRFGAPDLARRARRRRGGSRVRRPRSAIIPHDTLIAVHRSCEDGAVREAFRTLRPRDGARSRCAPSRSSRSRARRSSRPSGSISSGSRG